MAPDNLKELASAILHAEGRPRIDREVEGLIICMAEENRSWGYNRIVGALANLGYANYLFAPILCLV
jgi:hypothetical protein